MERMNASLAREEIFGIDINELNKGPTVIMHIEACSLASLTVYKDKAELNRIAKPQLKLGKVSKVIFKKISPTVDKDSFRVEVFGPGLIRDVFYLETPLLDDVKNIEDNQKTLKSQIEEYNKKLTLLTAKLTRLKTQRSVINRFSETLTDKRDENFKSQTSAFDPKHIETLSNFLDLYENHVESIDAKVMNIQDETVNCQNKIASAEQELKCLEAKVSEALSRELSVLVECRETDTVTLQISYIVGLCQWTPSYDIRVYSNDGNMKILYYGHVQQSTGEDWEPKAMFLSTSEPGIGENVPELPGQSITFRDALRLPLKGTKSKRRTKAVSLYSRDERMKSMNDDSSNLCLSDDNMTIKEFEMLKTPIKEVAMSQFVINEKINSFDKGEPSIKNEGVLYRQKPLTKDLSDPTVLFTVPNTEVIIPGDHLPHRAIVGVIDLHPIFEYVAVPKRTPYAFLKAKCHNGSSFAILPGPANIFIDNNFIGKTTLAAVAPQEDFVCDLGVDHGIKINYKPIYKYREASSGSSRISSMTFKQLIEIKNGHELNVRLLVRDQVPVSVEDKIKVTLVDPAIKSSDKNKSVRLTKMNILEWDLEMHPNEIKELTLKYVVEYPANEDIDVSVLSTDL